MPARNADGSLADPQAFMRGLLANPGLMASIPPALADVIRRGDAASLNNYFRRACGKARGAAHPTQTHVDEEDATQFVTALMQRLLDIAVNMRTRGSHAEQLLQARLWQGLRRCICKFQNVAEEEDVTRVVAANKQRVFAQVFEQRRSVTDRQRGFIRYQQRTSKQNRAAMSHCSAHAGTCA